MDILDGRRAVPGDTVEVLRTMTAQIKEEIFGVKPGLRFVVAETVEANQVYGKYRLLEKHLINKGEPCDFIFPAINCRLIPDDKKSDTVISFETDKETITIVGDAVNVVFREATKP